MEDFGDEVNSEGEGNCRNCLILKRLWMTNYRDTALVT